MDEGNEPERIEIELTSHDPAAVPSRRLRAPSAEADAGVTTESDSPGASGPLGTERGRLIAVGAGAAVVALLLGVLVGRIGSGEVESADEAATTSLDASTTTRPAGGRDTLPRAPEILAPTTTRPESVVTTTIPADEWIEGSITLNPSVAPEQAELIALTRRGALVRIDTITGETLTTQTDSRFGQPFLAATDVGVLTPDDGGGFTMIADDGSRSPFALDGWWPPIGIGGDLYWRAESDPATGQLLRLVAVRVDGSETGEVIELEGFYPQMADPLGGVVVQATGGSYRITPDSRERLTTGQLHALGERRALVQECDEQLECGFFVVDRATGDRRELELDPALGAQPQLGGMGWWGMVTPLSPSEDALLSVIWDTRGQAIGVLDMTTGSYVELGRFDTEPIATWGPSGRYVYWISAGEILVFDRTTGVSVPFTADLDEVAALTVRSPAGTTGDGN